MRDRAFGVEIECGYNGEGVESRDDCSCECWCESERRYLREQNNTYNTYANSAEASGNLESARQYRSYVRSDEYIDNYRCEVCRYGCTGDCREYYGDGDCEAAAYLLDQHGFKGWLDHIHPDGSGVEIPSPILRGPQGLRELRNVMELLSNNGFYVSGADGFHVHHDAPEFAQDEGLLAHTIELWEENFNHITRFVDPQRRGTRWAASRKGEALYSGRWETFKRTKNLSDAPSWRTCALNVEPVRYGIKPNVEIRLHEGTLDFRKAAAWIHFGQAFLHTAIRSYQRNKNEIRVCADALDVLRMTNLRGNSRRALMEVAALN